MRSSTGVYLPHNLPLVHVDHPSGDFFHDELIVGGDDDGRPFSIQIFKDSDDLKTVLGVQVSGGFIGEEERRMIDERSSDRHALLFSPGEFARVGVGPVSDVHRFKDLRDRAPDVAFGLANGAHGVGHIFPDPLVGKEAKVLRHDAHLPAQERNVGLLKKLQALTVQPDFAGGLFDLPREQFQEGGLTRSCRTAQKEKFALLYRERDVLEALDQF